MTRVGINGALTKARSPAGADLQPLGSIRPSSLIPGQFTWPVKARMAFSVVAPRHWNALP